MEFFVFWLCLGYAVDETKVSKVPFGHGLPLGKHRPSNGHVEVLHQVPSPEVFWQKYASKREPVVFQGAAKRFPAYKLWTDEYLIKNYGNLEVKLEAKAEKDKTPVGTKGLGRDNIKDYLDTYRTKDSYIVSQLPDPMAKDINILSCLSCGTFAHRILEADLWLSSGGTSSLLHRDADNAINCLLNGTKDWILINPKYEDKIPVARGDVGYGGFAVLDVNSVNLVKYSEFQNVPWQHANLTAGDCLFLPYGYWHQVRSYGNKNMAVSVLFSRLKEFDPVGCNESRHASLSLANASMVWTYPGHGPQTLGNGDPYEVRDSIAEMVRNFESRNEKLNSAGLLYKWFSEVDLLGDDNERENVAELMYEKLMEFTNGIITSNSVMNLSVDELKELVMLIDGDPANTEEYEHVVFSSEEIREMIQTVLVENDGNFTQNLLTQKYESLGGSEKIARELFVEMDLNKDGVATKAEMSQTLEDVLMKFDKDYHPDLSNDYYREELKKDKEIMGKIEEQHGEL